MTKLIVMTDLHILPPGERIIGLEPSARFAAALDDALSRHGDAERIILMGDLTHHGTETEYAELRRLLADLPLPVTLMLGNHDTRRAFRTAFPAAPVDQAGFVQSVIDTATHRLIFLDTLDPDNAPFHGGHLCPDRMAWLAEHLAESPRPCLVFQHHPPMDVGFDGMDGIRLDNGAEQLDLLARNEVSHLFAGHVHRTIAGQTRGIAWSIFKSPCHQMPMQLGAAPSSSSIDLPGGYGIIVLRSDGVIVHHADVGEPQDIRHDASSRS